MLSKKHYFLEYLSSKDGIYNAYMSCRLNDRKR